MLNLKKTIITGATLSLMLAANGQTQEFLIQTKKVGAPIQPTMYGLFFEDINYAADGGLYAEMIKNRSFEFPQNFMGWNVFGNVDLLTENAPFDRNPHYVRLSDAGHGHKATGIENEGFFGVAYKKGEDYRFSVWAKADKGDSKIRVEFINQNNDVINRQDIKVDSNGWKQYEIIMKASQTVAKGKLRIFLDSKNSVDLEHVSLFPVDTYRGERNGMRKDLAQALEDINPGVFRFPGGCIVEGTDLETRYDWKKSVGPVENRPLNENRWNYTFQHRMYPDYFQSYGLGFYEYFLLSEQMGAEPLPIVNCGLACQYQNDSHEAHVAVCDLDSYIQDAMDLIEFANGDVNTTWGKVRAEMGHPEPFNLKYIGVGNEQWGSEYPERLQPFITAIRSKYPKMQIVGSSGPNSEGADFDYLWPEMKRLKVDLVDEHFYRSEDWFLSQGARYDKYDRKGPKVFAGEYACHPKNRKNNFMSALSEAAFMTGLERNADIVHMATYAPLFAHVEGWQWRPDMIWFDNLNSVKSVNYYVQQMYGHNPGTNVLPLTMNGENVSGQNGLFASAVWDKKDRTYIVKVANTSDQPQTVMLNFKGIGKNAKANGSQTMLKSDNLDLENTLDNPNAVIPVESSFTFNGEQAEVELPAKSFMMYKVSL